MTLAELAATLPNGFHDGELLSVHFDIFSRSLTLSMNLWVGTLASDSEEEREKYKGASISLRGVSHIIVDEMDTTLAGSDSGTMGIDGVPTSASILPSLSAFVRNPSEVQRFYSLYVYDWNSYIHLACAEATIEWDAAPESVPTNPGAAR